MYVPQYEKKVLTGPEPSIRPSREVCYTGHGRKYIAVELFTSRAKRAQLDAAP